MNTVPILVCTRAKFWYLVFFIRLDPSLRWNTPVPQAVEIYRPICYNLTASGLGMVSKRMEIYIGYPLAHTNILKHRNA